jgi:hypothetical protein
MEKTIGGMGGTYRSEAMWSKGREGIFVGKERGFGELEWMSQVVLVSVRNL